MTDDPEKAYKESRKRLKYRFGNSAILSADFEKRLTNWPKIGNSDAKGIQEFSDFLQQVEIARDHIPSLKIFDFSSKLQSLVEKLPGWFKTKWSTKVQKLQQTDGHSAFPSFSEFVKEVNFHAERMNIPQISQASLGSINQRAASNQSTSSHRGSQTSTGQGSQITALATQSSPDGERSPTKSISKDSKSAATPDSLGTASTVNTAFCPYHRTKSHDLENCQKFRELDFSERKDFLFKKDSALTAQAQTSTSANIVIKVALNAKYAEGVMSQPFTTRQGQKTIPAKLHPPVLECAKTDPVVLVLGLFC